MAAKPGDASKQQIRLLKRAPFPGESGISGPYLMLIAQLPTSIVCKSGMHISCSISVFGFALFSTQLGATIDRTDTHTRRKMIQVGEIPVKRALQVKRII